MGAGGWFSPPPASACLVREVLALDLTREYIGVDFPSDFLGSSGLAQKWPFCKADVVDTIIYI